MKRVLNVFFLPILLSSSNRLVGAVDGDGEEWINKEFALRGAGAQRKKDDTFGEEKLEEPNCSLYGSCESATTTTTMKTPMLQVSFNLRELIERCTSAECSANDEMRIREPFYVEEPGWIQINRHYPDEFARRFGKNDPFFGTRGKKNSPTKHKDFRQRNIFFRPYINENPKDMFRELIKANNLPDGWKSDNLNDLQSS